LTTFEQLSGLKINFHKSELFCFGATWDSVAAYAELLVVDKVSFLLVIWGSQSIIGD
jgi:hypothetical protein